MFYSESDRKRELSLVRQVNPIQTDQAADFNPGLVTDERYAVERFALCLNSHGEVTSYVG